MSNITTRPLLEIVFTPSDDQRYDIILKWLEENSTFVHNQEDEFLLAIPPIIGKDKYIKAKYGENIPEEIIYILNQSIEINGSESDPGYILIFLTND